MPKKNVPTLNERLLKLKPNMEKEENPDKMDFLMRTVKLVHSYSTAPSLDNPDELEKHRAQAETFSKLINARNGSNIHRFRIESIKCEWTRPKTKHDIKRVILYCHGGGYISGGIEYAGILASKISDHTDMEVVSFEYRLAPEFPYPAALEDAIKVWNFLEHMGYHGEDIYLAGDSAGGNLALELCLYLKREKRILPGALILFSPWTDLTLKNASYEVYKDNDPVLDYEFVEISRKAFLGEAEDYDNPDYSPLFGDLSEMPPALIQVGSNEILRDDSELLYSEYKEAGSFARLEVYHGGWHVFQQMPVTKAGQALDNVKFFIDNL